MGRVEKAIKTPNGGGISTLNVYLSNYNVCSLFATY